MQTYILCCKYYTKVNIFYIIHNYILKRVIIYLCYEIKIKIYRVYTHTYNISKNVDQKIIYMDLSYLKYPINKI